MSETSDWLDRAIAQARTKASVRAGAAEPETIERIREVAAMLASGHAYGPGCVNARETALVERSH